jgi:transcriptional regulator with XRE-family HTH domain
MVLQEQLRKLREDKKLSQGDIEKRTGLLRCYISRVENGHTIPSLDTLEKLARAFEVPMYRFFTNEEKVKAPSIKIPDQLSNSGFGASGKEAKYLRALCKSLEKLEPKRRQLVLKFAALLAREREAN